jgi:carbamoyltransferase
LSVYSKEKGQIERVKEYNHKDFQLARIYRYTTLILKMLANEHEYKVMGLASYYNGPVIEKVEKVFDKMLQNDGLEFIFNKDVLDIYDYLKNNLKNFRFDHIAAGRQSFTEKILMNWFSSAISKYNANSVVFSGGVSMNVKANMKISQIPKIEKFFVCGAGTDEKFFYFRNLRNFHICFYIHGYTSRKYHTICIVFGNCTRKPIHQNFLSK